MTQATIKALEGLRDPSTIKWYAIPLLAIVLYVYAREIKEAKQTGNWDAVLAGLTLFGMDFFNETCNGWIMHLTRRSALWTTPGDTALRVMVGWNIEIIFMFLLAGIIYYHCLSEEKNTYHPENTGNLVLVHSHLGLLRTCRVSAECRRPACLGVLLLEPFVFRGVADLPAWLLYLFLCHKPGYNQENNARKTFDPGGYICRAGHYERSCPRYIGLELLILIFNMRCRPFSLCNGR